MINNLSVSAIAVPTFNPNIQRLTEHIEGTKQKRPKQLHTLTDYEMPLIHYKWRLEGEIGSGTFGKVYRAVNVHNNHEVAIKLETVRSDRRLTLRTEYEFYRDTSNSLEGFPRFYYYGDTPWSGKKALVMSLLGPTVYRLFNQLERTLSTSNILMIAIQGLQRIKDIHELGYVHRDIKPSNMLVGTSDPDFIYFMDFGMAAKFRSAGNRHCSRRSGQTPVGSKRYMSRNVHRGVTASRRDDLESFGYCLVELCTGSLPWASVRDLADVSLFKEATSTRELCQNAPSSLRTYMRNVKSLPFGERPSYSQYIADFQRSLNDCLHEGEPVFDWMNM